MDGLLFPTKIYNIASLNTEIALGKTSAEKNLHDEISESCPINLCGFFRVLFSANSTLLFLRLRESFKTIRKGYYGD